MPLTEEGELRLADSVLNSRNLPLDACVHTQFSRTRLTAELALEGRQIELQAEPLLDDIKVGELEGLSVDEYRDWKAQHDRGTPFPGGETLDVAARRYARAYRSLLSTGHSSVLVVCHEIPIRYALNAVAGSSSLDGPLHSIRTPCLTCSTKKRSNTRQPQSSGLRPRSLGSPQVPGSRGI